MRLKPKVEESLKLTATLNAIKQQPQKNRIN
uniref:Uncharacterized protein n=1 Tax=Rhizophora mucronata TaxID=61149 RepID=A0A2P2NN47_RHIMU